MVGTVRFLSLGMSHSIWDVNRCVIGTEHTGELAFVTQAGSILGVRHVLGQCFLEISQMENDGTRT